jgi:signal transduction histidine kinase
MSALQRKESLLVVEESDVIQSLFYETFHRRGYVVRTATSPQEGWKIYKQSPTTLVMTNIRFRHANGLRFILDLKYLDPDTAVIVLSADQDFALAQQAVHYGIYDLITIPFEMDDVLDAVTKAFEKKWLLDRNRLLIEKQAALIEKIHAAYQRLKSLDKLKTDFLVTVSHELLTPLTSVKALAHNLLKGVLGALTANQKQYIELIRENADRLEELLHDILHFSKLDAGHVRLKREPIELGPLIDKVVRSMEPVANEKGLSIQANGIRPAAPVFADRSRMEEILANLVENAIKYSRKGGKISVWQEENPNDVMVHVRDNGIGIPEEQQATIFAQFTQFHREEGPGTHGVGLGLAIVKKLVELHHGKIAVKSKLGKGTTFTFSVPKAS